MRHKIVLIGLGRIGALADLSAPVQDLPQTHLRAITRNRDFEITALVDPEVKNRNEIARAASLPTELFYADIQEVQARQADVVVIATPPANRSEVFARAIELQPRLVVFEKPLSLSVAEAENIQTACHARGITGIVNFHRRYDKGHRQFRSMLPQENPEKIVFHYSKGLWNYGSHAIDLITHWFGPIEKIMTKSIGRVGSDYVDAQLKLASGTSAHLISHDNSYDLFETEIFYSTQKFALRAGGVQKRQAPAIANLIYDNYTHLAPETDLLPPSRVSGMKELYEDIASFCASQDVYAQDCTLAGCTLAEAIEGLKIIEDLLQET